MTLAIQGLRPAQLKALDKKAKDRGKSTVEFVRSLIERELVAGETFDEILAPIREGFRKSGVTEAELDQIVDRARNDFHRKRRGRKARR